MIRSRDRSQQSLAQQHARLNWPLSIRFARHGGPEKCLSRGGKRRSDQWKSPPLCKNISKLKAHLRSLGAYLIFTNPNKLKAAPYNVPLCVSHICLTNTTLVILATTARPPAASIPMALNFILSGILAPQTNGIGTISTARSVTVLMIVSDRYITLMSRQVALGYGARSQ